MVMIRFANRHVTYPPPGRCIYCASPGDPDLHMEHIIPESLGGTFKIRKASCRACSVKTGAVEGHVVAKLFGDARVLLGMRRGKKRKWPDKFTAYVGPKPKRSGIVQSENLGGFEKKEVGAEDLAAGIIILNLPPAGILLGAEPDDTNFRAKSFSIGLPEDWKDRIERLGGNVLLGGTNEVTYEQFGLFLAKIAHSHAVAMLGLNGFDPFLDRAVRQERPFYLSHYVGGQTIPHPVKTDRLHSLDLIACTMRTGEKTLVIVRIRLFAVDNLPIYDVVVGRETADTKWPSIDPAVLELEPRYLKEPQR